MLRRAILTLTLAQPRQWPSLGRMALRLPSLWTRTITLAPNRIKLDNSQHVEKGSSNPNPGPASTVTLIGKNDTRFTVNKNHPIGLTLTTVNMLRRALLTLTLGPTLVGKNGASFHCEKEQLGARMDQHWGGYDVYRSYITYISNNNNLAHKVSKRRLCNVYALLNTVWLMTMMMMMMMMTTALLLLFDDDEGDVECDLCCTLQSTNKKDSRLYQMSFVLKEVISLSWCARHEKCVSHASRMYWWFSNVLS